MYKSKAEILLALTVPAGLMWLLIVAGVAEKLPSEGFFSGLVAALFFVAFAYVAFAAEKAIPIIKRLKMAWGMLAVWNLSFVIFSISVWTKG